MAQCWLRHWRQSLKSPLHHSRRCPWWRGCGPGSLSKRLIPFFPVLVLSGETPSPPPVHSTWCSSYLCSILRTSCRHSGHGPTSHHCTAIWWLVAPPGEGHRVGEAHTFGCSTGGTTRTTALHSPLQWWEWPLKWNSYKCKLWSILSLEDWGHGCVLHLLSSVWPSLLILSWVLPPQGGHRDQGDHCSSDFVVVMVVDMDFNSCSWELLITREKINKTNRIISFLVSEATDGNLYLTLWVRLKTHLTTTMRCELPDRHDHWSVSWSAWWVTGPHWVGMF